MGVVVDFATSVRAKRKSCIQHHVYTKTYENTSIRVKFSVFLIKKILPKQNRSISASPPHKKKYGRILNSTQRYMMNTNVLDIHVLFDSSCVTYIETFISEKLVQIYDLTFVKLNDQFCYLVIITTFDFGVFPTGRNYRQKTKYRQKCDCLETSVNHPYICQDKPAKELCTIAF